MIKRIIGDDAARFEARIERLPFSGCWIFHSSYDKFGYGRMWYGGRIERAHRVSWMLHGRMIPEGMWVLHRCDVPECVNPDHLFIGDRTDNMQDMASKGRQVLQVHPERAARGERAGSAKLNEEKVRAIKARLAAGVSLSVVAAEYGVCKAAIAHIRSGRNWTHIQ